MKNKGSQFGNLSTRTPDTYLKVLLISQSGNEIARGKTQVCRGQPNPLFRETFVFQVRIKINFDTIEDNFGIFRWHYSSFPM